MRYLLYPLAVLALLLLARSWGHAAEMKMDERLNQTITVNEKGDRLGNVLARVTKKTSVGLTCSTSLRKTEIVCRYTGTLGGFMDALAAFVAVGKGNTSGWVTIKDGYAIGNDRHALGKLRKERQETLDQAMNQALQDGNRWVKHLGFLTDQRRRDIYAGGSFTSFPDLYGGRGYLKEVLRDDEPNWSDRVNVTYEMKGHSPLTRMLVRRLEDVEHGTIVTETFTVAQLCPQLAPETQQKEWLIHYGGLQPRGGNEAAVLWPVSQRETISRREALLRIAEKAGVNLIADDFGQEFRPDQFPNKAALSAMLDAACKFQHGSGQTPDTNHGSFWRKVGDTYLVRSIAWPEEEAALQ